MNLYYNDLLCGKVSFYEQGIYTIFEVESEIVNLDICKVYLQLPSEIPLGILMPKDGKYILTKKIPTSYLRKYPLNNTLTCIIRPTKTASQKSTSNGILKDTIEDSYLKSCICERVYKKCFATYDMYFFYLDTTQNFLFDFCYSFCKITFINNLPYICIMTNKLGKIIV